MSVPSHLDENPIHVLYHNLLQAWNQQSALGMAELFTSDGNMIGFDGSLANGQNEIGEHLAPIFLSHPTATYISKVREVRFLSPTVAMLRAVAGMIPRGKNDIMPAVNAIQTVVAVKNHEHWRIALFQNTPAAFHGRQQLADDLTKELRDELKLSNISEKSSQGF
ncbi:SgcJ/EcaC family oxidoreductase [Bdellovibrio sp. HCB-162]|uniref:SgcJ/EcaC family oxidoreductase n=1 Tax=Bdellovibrio sp. HCB-162 TaxID=3394234 RepID=UPI0039BCE854